MIVVIVGPTIKAHLRGGYEQRQAVVVTVEALISYSSLYTQSADRYRGRTAFSFQYWASVSRLVCKFNRTQRFKQ